MKKLKKYYLFFAYVLMLCFSASAQENNLKADIPYFEKQATIYQRWLDKSGIGQYLSFRELDVRDTTMSVYLEFPFSDIDSVMTAYEEIKKVFENVSPLSMEQQLFYKASHLMQVEPSAIYVEIYDSYDVMTAALFERVIYFEAGKIQIFESNPKTKKKEVFLSPKATSDGKTPTVMEYQKKFSKEVVFDSLYAYAERKFESKSCLNRKPEVYPDPSDEILRFVVVDLCKVVLTHETEGMLCNILSLFDRPCNWAKREMLTFTIVYEPTEKGYRLDLEIEGKYGSGFYQTTNRGEYLDMEIDFDENLEFYAMVIASEFKEYLKTLIIK